VAKSELVRRLLVAISGSLPDDADLSAVDVESDDDVTVVLHTRTPGLLIGRRGATADAIRSKLQDVVDDGVVRLNIREVGSDDPPAPPSGVREPRRPPPAGPSPLNAEATDDWPD
jgi:ribosomal protein S3